MGQGASAATERQMYAAAALKADGVARRVSALQAYIDKSVMSLNGRDSSCLPASLMGLSPSKRPFEPERLKEDIVQLGRRVDVAPSVHVLADSLRAFDRGFEEGHVQLALTTERPPSLSYRFLRSMKGPPREAPTETAERAGLLQPRARASRAAAAVPRLLQELEVTGGGAEFDSVAGLARVFLELGPGTEARLFARDDLPPALAALDRSPLGACFMLACDLLADALELYYLVPPAVGRHMTDLAALLGALGVEVPPALSDPLSKAPGSNVAVLSFRYGALAGVDRVALFRTGLARREVPPLPHPLPELVEEGPPRSCAADPRFNLALSVPRSGGAAAAHTRLELDYS